VSSSHIVPVFVAPPSSTHKAKSRDSHSLYCEGVLNANIAMQGELSLVPWLLVEVAEEDGEEHRQSPIDSI